MRMASPEPIPNIWMKETFDSPKAKKVTARSAAAVVMMRPVRANPWTTASSLP